MKWDNLKEKLGLKVHKVIYVDSNRDPLEKIGSPEKFARDISILFAEEDINDRG